MNDRQNDTPLPDNSDDVFFVNEEPNRLRAPIKPQRVESPINNEESEAEEKRRERPPRPQTGRRVLSSTWAFFRTTSLAFLAAILSATVFSYWTPEETLPDSFQAQMRVVRTTYQPFAAIPTSLPTQAPVMRIGIIAGHSGPLQDGTNAVDPGAVCDDNFDGIAELTELEINEAVAQLVVNQLLLEGYEVDLLDEWDPRLDDYRASALVSIHTNDCLDYGGGATGYNVVGPYDRGVTRGADEALVRCIINEYGAVTGLPRHFGVTDDMTLYHSFDEISYDTPTAIIEIGFMFADRVFLTQNRQEIANGIVAGILCFMDIQTR